ncbi:hypothetical protein, partial [Nocardia cerradoensis]|uniref:hypothetical protein n=1 Tax=Nocardia cerradoensis TaxID=85688 RepID=UPI0016746CC4
MALLPLLLLEQPLAKVAVNKAAEVTASTARGTSVDRRDDTFFKAIADTPGLMSDQWHTQPGVHKARYMVTLSSAGATLLITSE